jgi:acetolactate synthase-1/2/3 large subunit
MVKLSDYIFSFIADQGVKHVFMLPGGGAMHLVDSLGRCERLNYTCNLHEQACAIAAEANARVTGKLGVALVTTGPGGTNAITGVVGAWLDSTPTIFISGQVKRPDLIGTTGVRQLGVQEINIVDIVRPVVKYAVTITDPNLIRYELEKAVYFATSGRNGPVWLDVPLDIQCSYIDPDTLPSYKPEIIPVSQDFYKNVSEVVSLLKKSERPVILAGNGIRLANAMSSFSDLVETLRIPILTSPLGIDLLTEDNPYYCGRPGSLAPRGANFTLQNSDLLIIIGSRMDMAMLAYDHKNLARGAKKVMVDIDHHEIEKMKTTIDVPICADAGVFINEFLKQLSSFNDSKKYAAWLEKCIGWKQKYPIVLDKHRNQKEFVSTYYFSEVLSQELNEDDVIASGSSGIGIELFLFVHKVKRGQRVFHNRGTGAMGFALPAAIGACIGADGKRTVTVDGDGGFQMNIQELATLVNLNLPIKFFIINNQGYSSIRQMQRGYFNGNFVACDSSSGLSLPNHEKIIKAYGLQYFSISDHKNMQQTIKQVLNTPGTVFCEVFATPDEVREPRVASKQRSDGSMVSSPLEDLWPFLDRSEFLDNMIIKPVED